MNLVMVEGGKYKDMISGRMQRENGAGSWMVYKECDLEYAEQVTAEHKVNVRTGNGKKKLAWIPKTSHADNHYLDCEVYAMAFVMTVQEKLVEVNNAISNILVGGQEYRIGSRSLTRADLNTLLDMQRDLQSQLANQESHLMDNTYLAVFDGR